MSATLADYGCSAEHLETLRDLVEARCRHMRFAGHTVTSARLGEYRFRFPPWTHDGVSRSVYVQAPITPEGKPRGGLGIWRYRFGRANGKSRPWERAADLEAVVDWIERQCDSRP